MQQILANALVTSAFYVLAGLSFSLIYSTSRFFNFVHAGYIIIAPYAAFFLAVTADVPWPVAFAGALAVGITVAVVFDSLIFQRLIEWQAPPVTPLLASLGLYVVVQATVSLLFGAASLSFGLGDGGVYEIARARLSVVQIATILAATGGTISVWVFLHQTMSGKLVRALGNDRELVRLRGTDPARLSLVATGLGAMLAGSVGCLSAADVGLTPTAGFQLLLGGVVAMVIGGVGSTAGLVIGALLVASLEHGIQWWVSSEWARFILFAVLLLFLLMRPAGILGQPARATSTC